MPERRLIISFSYTYKSTLGEVRKRLIRGGGVHLNTTTLADIHLLTLQYSTIQKYKTAENQNIDQRTKNIGKFSCIWAQCSHCINDDSFAIEANAYLVAKAAVTHTNIQLDAATG